MTRTGRNSCKHRLQTYTLLLALLSVSWLGFFSWRGENLHTPHLSSCVNTETIENVSSVVCLKEDDLTVSREIALDGSWEREEVGFIIRAMRAYSQAVFVG